MRPIILIGSAMLVTMAGATNAFAQDDCQRFKQDDGTTKILCKDKKGRWIEQEDNTKLEYDPLTKAEMVYEGTFLVQAYRKSGGGQRSSGISLGSLLGSMILQPVGSPKVERVKLTVNYEGNRVSLAVYSYVTKKTYRHSGTRSKDKCKITFLSGQDMIPLEGRCDQEKFDMSGDLSVRNGGIGRVKFDVRPTGYTDYYKAELEKRRIENERKRLHGECYGEIQKLESCTALEEYGGPITAFEGRPSSNTASPHLVFNRRTKLNLEQRS